MSQVVLHYFPGQAPSALLLAKILSIPSAEISIHAFPDGESLVRVAGASRSAFVFCTLDHPNEKLVNLLFAAAALRDNGAERLILVAPYLCYMRQDIAFNPGEAVSQKAIGEILSGAFDRIITVDPHLHRTTQLSEVFPATRADALTAANGISEWLTNERVSQDTVLVGPDEESRQWVEATADPLGIDVLIGNKRRLSDRSVTLKIPSVERVTGRPTVIIDDLVVSGGTVCTAARLLLDAGATSIDVIVVHPLFGDAEISAMRDAGIRQVISTDSISHPTNAITLAPIIAGALKNEIEQ